jgi:OOP family OmpA-OmpF porin
VAAGAQLAYDCWVEEQEEGWQLDCIEKCRADFLALMAQLEARPAAAPAPAAPPAPRQFIVFFDFDRSNITAEGARVIQQVIASYRQKAGPISVVGHTDRSGTPQYNQGLSVRRANSVKAALVRGQIPANQVSTAGRGESEPRVPTPDGVREPQNRRAEIRIQ